MSAFVHTLRVVLAGVGLAGAQDYGVGWGRARAGAVRALGKRYAKVGSANLAQLAIFAVEQGLAGSCPADG